MALDIQTLAEYKSGNTHGRPIASLVDGVSSDMKRSIESGTVYFNFSQADKGDCNHSIASWLTKQVDVESINNEINDMFGAGGEKNQELSLQAFSVKSTEEVTAALTSKINKLPNPSAAGDGLYLFEYDPAAKEGKKIKLTVITCFRTWYVDPIQDKVALESPPEGWRDTVAKLMQEEKARGKTVTAEEIATKLGISSCDITTMNSEKVTTNTYVSDKAMQTSITPTPGFFTRIGGGLARVYTALVPGFVRRGISALGRMLAGIFTKGASDDAKGAKVQEQPNGRVPADALNRADLSQQTSGMEASTVNDQRNANAENNQNGNCRGPT